MKYPKRSQYKYAKTPYKVRNWAAYEAGLRSRGDVTIWFTDDARNVWCHNGRRKPGGQRIYSNCAIETFWTISMVCGLPLRYKTIIGREMKARTLAGQRVEARIGCSILNRMAKLGMPESYRAA